MSESIQRVRTSIFSAVIGNILQHYDSAIFGVLAPVIAPMFFGDKDPVVALILTYFMIPLGLLTKPLGAFVFGRMGDRYGRITAVSRALNGMAFSTMLIGFLPTYQSVGATAPLLLVMCRLLQGFFAAGETSGSVIYLLESTEDKKRDFMSSLFDASSILGVLIASAIATFFGKLELIELYWRHLFWLGGLAAFLGIYLRRSIPKESSVAKVKSNLSAMEIMKKYKGAFLTMVIAGGFSHATYAFSFTLMAGFVPLVSPHLNNHIMEMNTGLLALDLILLPLFGLIATRMGKTRLMLRAALATTILTPLAFAVLDFSSFASVALIRTMVVVGGVAFSAAYYSFALELIPREVRYTLIAVSSAFGALIFGRSTAVICLSLYKMTGMISAISIYFVFLSLAATVAIALMGKRSAVKASA